MKRRAELGASVVARLLSSLASERARKSYRSLLTSSDATHTWTSSVISSSDVNDVNFGASSDQGQLSDAGLEIKPPWSSRTRIHEQTSVDPGDELLVGVSVHYDVGIITLG